MARRVTIGLIVALVANGVFAPLVRAIGVECCFPVNFQDGSTNGQPNMITAGYWARADLDKVDIVVPNKNREECEDNPVGESPYRAIGPNPIPSIYQVLQDPEKWKPYQSWLNYPEYQNVNLMINANFFDVVNPKRGAYSNCGNGYGVTVSKKTLISYNYDDEWAKPDALVFRENNPRSKARRVEIVTYYSAMSEFRRGVIENAISGYRLLFNGQYRRPPEQIEPNNWYPRTAVGLDRDGKLVVVVINPGNNGKKNNTTEFTGGARLESLANYMRDRLNVVNALALDGSGSSQFYGVGNSGQKFYSLASDTRSELNALSPNGKYFRPIPIVLGIRERR